MTLPPIRWTVVLAGAVFYLLLGELWYSRRLLRNVWRRWAPDPAIVVDRSVRGYAVSIVYALVSSWLLALVVGLSGTSSFAVGAGVGCAACVGTKALSLLVYSGYRAVDQRSWWIHASYQIVAFAALGGSFAVWS
jgi:hypothetical protein